MYLEQAEHERRIRDAERLACLTGLDLLDSPSEAAFDRLTSLASRIFGSPISLVSIIDADRQYFKSFVGLGEREAATRQTSLDYSFCQYAVSTRQPLIIEDARQDPVLKDNLGLVENNVIAYAGIPLITSEGVALGAFCVAENKPRRWTEAEIDILRDLAQAVMTEIELRREVRERRAAEAGLHHQIDLLSSVIQANTELNRMLNVSYVLRVGLETALRLSHAESGYLGLLEAGALRLKQVIGPYSEAAINTYIASDTSIVARVVRTRLPEYIADVRDDPDYVALIPQTRSKIVIPLVSRDHLIGVLNLETSDPDCFNDDLFSFLLLLIARVAVAVDNAQLYELLQTQLEELRAAHEKLSHLEQLKTDMIRIAAHDLRNPISIILGYLHLMQRTVSQPTWDEIAPLLEPISEAAGRMQSITNDILSLQRVEALAADTAATVDLNQIVSKIYAGLRAVAEGKGLAFTLDVPPGTLSVCADEAYLTEAVANLVNNAIKYTPEGRAVQVRVRRDGDRALFEVEDTGIGIPESEQKKLFQPFSRVRSQETADIEGTGLGLYLVRQVVERFNGQMRFHSVHGQGSTFGFALPLAAQRNTPR